VAVEMTHRGIPAEREGGGGREGERERRREGERE